MPSDRSRRSDDIRDRYKAPIAQQGRVILDRDFNALQGLISGRIDVETLDIVGPSGTPDDGFAISLPQSPPAGPPLWSPPSGFDLSHPDDFDFLVSPGTMYVGGQRAFFAPRQSGHPVTYSYFDQPDWIAPTDPVLFESPPGNRELVLLDLADQEVSGIEDPDLLEVALGGPDTTQRLKLLTRVKREAVDAFNCTTAWQELTSRWLQREGLSFDPDSMRLEPVARLKVGFVQDTTTADICDPVATGGYLGADNQLIRVQISHPGSRDPSEPARLLWGYDNASFLYRVTSVSSDGTMLTLAPDPPDAFHIPTQGQLVEILRTGAVLGRDPDQTDSSGERSIPRVIAEPTGELRRLAKPYAPIATGDPTSYIVLDAPLAASYRRDHRTPLFLRVWQAELSFNAAGDTVALDDPASGTTTGIEVTISLPEGEIATNGAYWLLAVRPSTPQAVYPQRLLSSPQPADGPRRWVCPLAVIDWTRPEVIDCRNKFDNLVELSRRPPSCCTVRISTDDLVQSSLQSLINRAARLAEQVTVCLAPGSYKLDAPLRFDRRHNGMVIEGCGGVPLLEGAGDGFEDGLIVVTQVERLTLRKLQIVPPAVDIPEKLLEALAFRLERCVVIPAKRPVAEFSKLLFERLRLQIAIGVRAVNSNALSLDDCTMTLSGGSSRDYAGISLFAQGYCVGLSVCNCRFETTFVPTATPGVVQEMPLARPGATPPLPVVASASFADTRVIAREGLRMAVGCLVCPHIDNFPDPNADGVERVSFPTLLDGGSFTGNVFSEMTFAIMATAKTGLVRIHGNTVVDCIGGFWLKSNEAVGAEQPPELHFAIGERVPPEGDTLWINLAISLQEALVLTALGLAYQLPDGVTTGVSGIAVSASMLIGDNKVGALPLNPERAPTAFPALAVITGPSDAGVDTGGSMTISANRFQARPNLDYPCVLLAYFGRCAVTGNLISAEPFGSPPHNVSLTVIPQGFRKRGSEDQFLAPNLAVSGNVMEGGTDLDLLLRPDVTTPPLTAPFNTWLPFNSVA